VKQTGSRSGHLTYCTNIHPGETWGEVLANLKRHTVAVKMRVSPNAPFGIGLRLSARAALELEEPTVLEAFREFLVESGMYVFTINGFPYGPFHGQPVKEQVYRPDWTEDERVGYSDRLARLLAALLPRTDDLEGSISTVPGCFRLRDGEGVRATIAQNIVRHAATLVDIARNGGPIIGIALEPEPHCLLETNAEAIDFIVDWIFADTAAESLAKQTGLSLAEAHLALRRHVGICLDTCHAAVEFESLDEILTRLRQSGVRVLKLQITAGLELYPASPEGLAVLRRFGEGVYLHQTVIQDATGGLQRFLDLPDALAAHPEPCDERWRVHFHVPLFQSNLMGLCPGFNNTGDFVRELLAHHHREPLSQHLEVETYTWDVLPSELRAMPVDEAIAREIEWVVEQQK
jgi:sugar phosphate isomerase/epimerase